MTVLAIIALILTVPVWLLYHRIFHVVYFGRAIRTIIGELVACMFVSIFIVAICKVVLQYAFGFIGTVLFFLIKVALIIGGVVLVIYVISKIIETINNKKEDKREEKYTDNTFEQPIETSTKLIKNKNVESLDNSSENSSVLNYDFSENCSVDNDDEKILLYIKNHFQKGQLLEAVRYYREVTHADVNTAKTAVMQIWTNEDTSNCQDSVTKTDEIQESIKNNASSIDVSAPNNHDEKMFCVYCGKKIFRTAKYCNYCGKENTYGLGGNRI